MTKSEIPESNGGAPSPSFGLRASLVIRHSSFVIFFYALDQLTKWWIVRNFEIYSARTVIPGFFDLVYVTNTGAAFGSFKDSNLFFIVLSAVTLIALLFFHWRGSFRDSWSRVGFAFLVSGILGNLTDRIVHHHVIDFLDFYVGANHWPAFNVADSCICIAVALFLIASLRESRVTQSVSS